MDKVLYKKAENKYERYPHIYLFHGDSGVVLNTILSGIDQPCLFWLDAHYSEGITAKGKLETPIMEEVTTILNHGVKDHVILIDDARCFTGEHDYPTVDQLRQLIHGRRRDFTFEVKDDIVRIHPRLR